MDINNLIPAAVIASVVVLIALGILYRANIINRSPSEITDSIVDSVNEASDTTSALVESIQDAKDSSSETAKAVSELIESVEDTIEQTTRG